MKIQFNQEIAGKDKPLSEKAIESIEKSIRSHVSDIQNSTVSACLITDEEIKKLNRMYRGKDSVTDVLSFAYEGGESLGDIVISFEQAKRQAEDGDIELEVSDLLVHGILHVLGHDHENPEDSKTMFKLQDEIIAHAI